METCVLINNKTLSVVVVTESVEQAEYWAALKIPKDHDFLITGMGDRDFWCYTQRELATLITNLTGNVHKWEDHSVARFSWMVADHMHRCLQTDTTPVEELRKMLGRTLEPTDPRPAQVERPSAPATPTAKAKNKAPQGVPSRPSAGTTTGRVWEIADELQDRAAVIKACTDEGINKSTATTQYGKWKKAQ